jgi:hypothetical protein
MKNTSGKCPSSCSGKTIKLEAKNDLKNNSLIKEKTVAVTPNNK